MNSLAKVDMSYEYNLPCLSVYENNFTFNRKTNASKNVLINPYPDKLTFVISGIIPQI